jgi:hypothetical protein
VGADPACQAVDGGRAGRLDAWVAPAGIVRAVCSTTATIGLAAVGDGNQAATDRLQPLLTRLAGSPDRVVFAVDGPAATEKLRAYAVAEYRVFLIRAAAP